MAYESNDKKMDSVYSKRVKAGKRRTYFFDVRETRGNDFYLTITESRKRAEGEGYDRHKIFLYKEDFNKFLKGLNETVDHIKTELMPDFDFDAFNHDNYEDHGEAVITTNAEAKAVEEKAAEVTSPEPTPEATSSTPEAGDTPHEEVDKW